MLLSEFYIFLCLVLLGLLQSTSATRLVIAAYCMGDADILPYWLEYHSALLGGAENILIFDKSEGIEDIFQILKPWNEKKGLKVEVKSGLLNYPTRIELALQSVAKHFPTADMALVLSVDEFLVSFQDGVPVLGKTPFLASLQTFVATNAACGAMNVFAYTCNKDAKTDNVATVDTFRLAKANPVQRTIVYKVSAIPTYTTLECNTVVPFGLLKYPTRSPTRLVQAALVESHQFGTVKPEVTLKNIKEHELYLFNLTTFVNYPGRNRVMQLLIYAMHGYDGVSIPCRLSDRFVGNITTVVNSVKV